MTKKYEVLVVEIDEVVEEAVVLLVNGVIVKCFASYCPFKIEVGKQYEVEFDLVLPDHDFVVVAQEASAPVEMIGDGFSCVLYGYLDGSVFRSFVDFPDQEIHYEFPYLNEKYVKVTVGRIDVAF
jgi:hypothetical protein